MTIRVRIPYTVLPDIESMLVKAGIPPMAERRGLMNRWFDPTDDAWVHEWIPESETLLPLHTCPTCLKTFRGADDRFCPDCHREAQRHGPLGAAP